MATLPKTSRQIAELFKSGTRLRYQKGEILLHAGDTPKGVYLIEQGYIKVYTIRNSGDLNLHVIYKPGEMFPLIWAYQGKYAPVYYEAMDDVIVRRCARESFRSLVFGDPAVAKLMLEDLAGYHWVYANRIENLELARSYDRVIFRLITLAERVGAGNNAGEVVLQAPVTQQDIADSLNMIRETASREIEKLEKQGLVAYRDHRLVITDLAKLRQEMARLH